MRRRKDIIDLETEKVYINESSAASELGISRYYIHKSIIDRVPVKGKMFSLYYHGIIVNDIKSIYLQNHINNLNSKIIRSKKWQTLEAKAALTQI